jgi:hypothetical protein
MFADSYRLVLFSTTAMEKPERTSFCEQKEAKKL